jgi:hypothetical protein
LSHTVTAWACGIASTLHYTLPYASIRPGKEVIPMQVETMNATVPAELVGKPNDEAWRALRRLGWTDSTISAAYGVSRQRIGQVIGPHLRHTGRRVYEIRMRPEAHERLRRMAEDHGMRLVFGPRTGQGSVSDLMEAIADGTLKVTPAKRRSKAWD